MKKYLYFLFALTLLTSCQESLEDRAEKDAREFTRKMCPTPYVNYERTDSCVFDKSSRTYIYYRDFNDKADNKEIISKNRKALRNALIKGIADSQALRKFKDAKFRFRYVYRSASTGDVLLDETVSEKDYK